LKGKPSNLPDNPSGSTQAALGSSYIGKGLLVREDLLKRMDRTDWHAGRLDFRDPSMGRAHCEDIAEGLRRRFSALAKIRPKRRPHSRMLS
jgi:hypothetical protein